MDRDPKIPAEGAAPAPTPTPALAPAPAPAESAAGAADRLAAAARRPITLVGLMGAGKSSIGKRLALRLRLPFVDADTEIETAAGLPIPEIFERFGEAHFRDGERRVIARLIDGLPKVIATGGGAFMNEETRTLLLARTQAVWLNAEVSTLVDRVRRRGNRPLLAGRDPGVVLAELAAVRNPVYALAPIQVLSRPGPHHHMVEAIISALAVANADEIVAGDGA